MRSARLAALALPLLAALFPAAARGQLPTTGAKDQFALKDGDRVVFYGDSITEQRLYSTFAETYAITRFPKARIDFVHSGWGGDRVGGGGGGPIDLRLARDVEAYKPTVVTIMLGMNDGSYTPFRDEIFNTYANGYNHIVEKLIKDVPGIRLTLIQPSPYDDVTRPAKFEDGYNSVLLKYGDFVRKLAQKSNSNFADLNTPVVEATKRAFASDPELAVKLNQDRIHPGPGGQLLMAEALLKAWNAPAVVSKVTIGAEDHGLKLRGSENTSVTNLALSGDLIHWEQLDEALPFPINLKDPVTELAVRSSDIVAALDQQVVKVTGLDADNYTLSIDGESVGTFGKAQLAEGVNLALLGTPMSRQAAKVHELTLRHNNMHHTRWRTIHVPNQTSKSPGLVKALEGLDDLEAEVIGEQRATAQPKSHSFDLKPKA